MENTLEKITASEGKIFILAHDNFILGKEIYVGYVFIDEVQTEFDMSLIIEVDESTIVG